MSTTPQPPLGTGRKQRAADAAIEVIASDGLRGLTHRAVDTRAGLPSGSTSSCFRTRLDLQRAVLARMLELDQDMLARLPTTGWSIATVEQRRRIAEMLTELLEYWLGPARHRSLARLELYLDATRHAELGPELEAANLALLERVEAGMRGVGLPDPEQAARLLVAQLDGLLYDALARPFLAGEQRARLRWAVDRIVHGYLKDTDG